MSQINIQYCGKMNDLIPAWVFTTATKNAYDLGNSRKIYDYLKQKHGNKKIKIINAEILQISPYGIWSNMAIVSTCFTVGGKWYQVLQAITMYTSYNMSSVEDHDIIFGDSDGFILEA